MKRVRKNPLLLNLVLTLAAVVALSPAAAAQDRRAEATDTETRTLALGPSGAVELENVAGDIECVVGSGPDVVVQIDRVARGRSDREAQLGLREVRTVVDQQGERATVRVQYPPDRRNAPYSVSVRYTVSAPAGTRLTITTVSGDVRVRDITGGLNARTVSGDVEISNAGQISRVASVSGDVTITGGATTGSMEAESVSGDVRITNVQADRVDARSVSGDIEIGSLTTAQLSLASTSGDVEFEGGLQRQGRYEIRSHSGDVYLRPGAAAGYELRATTFSGRIEADAATDGSGNAAGRSLRTTVGDGSAVIEATTFSGNVTVTTR